MTYHDIHTSSVITPSFEPRKSDTPSIVKFSNQLRPPATSCDETAFIPPTLERNSPPPPPSSLQSAHFHRRGFDSPLHSTNRHRFESNSAKYSNALPRSKMSPSPNFRSGSRTTSFPAELSLRSRHRLR